jgi:hypothetical protein
MSSVPPARPPAPAATPAVRDAIKLYSHASFFYWWPVWAVGYLMALLTYFKGTQIHIGNSDEWFFPGKSVGVLYALTLFLVILITNINLRGLSSVIAILTVVLLTVVFAYLGWWDQILTLAPNLSVHINLGFYLLFSTLMFLFWAGSFFIYDRMSFWVVRPGQITHQFLVGGSARSYDTRGVVFEKVRNDVFRHWVLGFGSADLRFSTSGARREECLIPNVIFADAKVAAIQSLIAMRSEDIVRV